MRTPPSPPSGLFDDIAPRYDLLNLVLSGGVVMYWDYKLARALPQGLSGLALDLGCGTLGFRRALFRRAPGLRLIGLDPSRPMLKKGLARLPEGILRHTLPVQGRAEHLPLPDNCLDLVVSKFVLRNLQSRAKALAEAHRVLKPGGRLLVLEFGSGRKRIWGGLYNFYLARLLPRLAQLFSTRKDAYAYLAQSILDFPASETIIGEIRAAGFTDVTCRAMTAGIVFMYTARKA